MKPDTLRDALEAVRAGTSAASIGTLAPMFVSQACPRGTALLAQGETWRDAFIVGSGLLRMHFVRRDGREFNKNFFAEGALVCPLTPAMWAAPSLFSISTVEHATLWRCDAASFRAVLESNGDWAPLRTELLVRLLTAKLQREHSLLAFDGRTRYENYCTAKPQLSRRIPLRHLASFLGLTDVSLSRLRKQHRDDMARRAAGSAEAVGPGRRPP